MRSREAPTVTLCECWLVITPAPTWTISRRRASVRQAVFSFGPAAHNRHETDNLAKAAASCRGCRAAHAAARCPVAGCGPRLRHVQSPKPRA
eukprot:scaffold117951_cov53-Phaeocystis_antarctica.AAC.3